MNRNQGMGLKRNLGMTDTSQFDEQFCDLTGAKSPFPWQRRLWALFAQADFDSCRTCSLPTGLGKTSIIPIWLLALAANPTKVPRRLVYVVNRRTVVDQASDEVRRIRARLVSNKLSSLSRQLRAMSGFTTDVPLAVSTLRGEFADNAEWRIDPARPAVVVGTVDMIGSRLLFSGYGAGFKSRSIHAGLLGQDSLVIHDEAHLEPAFQSLLEAIASEQAAAGDIRPLRVVALTATSRGAAARPFVLDDNDAKDPTVARRLTAKKRLRFHECGSEKEVTEQMVEEASGYADSGSAVLVFARRVDAAERIASELTKKKQRVSLLTGTMRGLERDRLASTDPVFARFLPQSSRPANVEPAGGTVYLVCTSAGEVGINISADHLVCDLTTFDSMAQRFGRVNRFGDGDASISVIHPLAFDPKEPLVEQRCATLQLLRLLPAEGGSLSASPADLAKLPEDKRIEAFTPPPDIPLATEILFDAWTLTTIRHDLPGRPPVADWLHGIEDWQPPDTYVAWRQEVGLLAGDIAQEEIEELLADFPLKPHELLRDRQSRVFDQLRKMADRRPEDAAWLVSPSGQLTKYSLRSLAEKNSSNSPVVNIANCQIILAPESGGLSPQGTFDGDSTDGNDVADSWYDENDRASRIRLWDDQPLPSAGPWRLVRIIDTVGNDDTESAEHAGEPRKRFWKWFVRPRMADDDGSLASTAAQELHSHLSKAAAAGQQVATSLGLPIEVVEAVVACLKWHDLGKDRRIWQAAIGNGEYAAGKILAKSGGRMRPELLSSYRHELGSILDLIKRHEAELATLTSPQRELVLHLIAAHHGRARPHFPSEELFDPGHLADDCDRIAIQVPDRFARLQRLYGRWGLAWLEAIVRAADAIASQADEDAA